MLPHKYLRLFGRLSLLTLLLVAAKAAYAIPAFARMYGTSCSTCHIDFPKLNDFGKAFKDAGFKFPKDDETMLKIPPVMLGAPANKELWPKSIWPGTIPGIPPIGFQMTSYFQYTGSNSGNFAALTPAGTLPPFVPSTDFQTGLFSLFSAGNFGSDIAFWVNNDLSFGGGNANAGLGDVSHRPEPGGAGAATDRHRNRPPASQEHCSKRGLCGKQRHAPYLQLRACQCAEPLQFPNSGA